MKQLQYSILVHFKLTWLQTPFKVSLLPPARLLLIMRVLLLLFLPLLNMCVHGNRGLEAEPFVDDKTVVLNWYKTSFLCTAQKCVLFWFSRVLNMTWYTIWEVIRHFILFCEIVPPGIIIALPVFCHFMRGGSRQNYIFTSLRPGESQGLTAFFFVSLLIVPCAFAKKNIRCNDVAIKGKWIRIARFW